MLVTSRSLREYEAFFALTPDDLSRRILDCSAGASGFVAEVNAAGGAATAVDPAYADPAEVMMATATSSTVSGAAIIDDHRDAFTWSWYGTPERRAQLRQAALDAFGVDRREHPDTYVVGALPDLPFAGDTFDLALCSHLLFTWADTLDEAWHRQALRELLRVAPEVRVFPLVHAGTGDPVAFLPGLLDELRADGHVADVVDVPYEFQRGAHQMLRLRRRVSGHGTDDDGGRQFLGADDGGG